MSLWEVSWKVSMGSCGYLYQSGIGHKQKENPSTIPICRSFGIFSSSRSKSEVGS